MKSPQPDAMTDTEMLDWLAERCWFPNDHPDNEIAVLVPEQFSPLGSFTCNRYDHRKALRAAITAQATHEQPRTHFR